MGGLLRSGGVSCRSVVLLLWCALCVWLCCVDLASAVDRHKFRTCKDTAFCRRNRPSSASSDSTTHPPTSLPHHLHLLVTTTAHTQPHTSNTSHTLTMDITHLLCPLLLLRGWVLLGRECGCGRGLCCVEWLVGPSGPSPAASPVLRCEGHQWRARPSEGEGASTPPSPLGGAGHRPSGGGLHPSPQCHLLLHHRAHDGSVDTTGTLPWPPVN